MIDSQGQIALEPTSDGLALAFLATDLVAFALLDRSGVLIEANEAFLRMVGRERRELRARELCWRDVTAEEQWVLGEKGLAEARASGSSMPYEGELVARDGARRPVLIGYTHVIEHSADAAFVIDQTARRRTEATLRESQRQLATLIANLPGLAFRWKVDGNWTPEFVSEGIRTLAGHSPADFLSGRISFRDLLHPDDLARVTVEIERAVARRRPFEILYRIQRADGRTRWVHSCGRGVYARDQRPLAIEGFASDVTPLKHAEEELRANGDKKDAFLALLAHELRNPLAPLLSGIELLRLAGLNRPEHDDVVEMCERQVLALTRLVDDLLELARVTHGVMELRREVIDLASVVDRALETNRALIRARRHELRVDVPPDKLIIEGDQVRLAQVVGNLLTNAAKYTAPGGTIEIALARENDDAVVRVRDSGAGIPEDMIERVFDMFAQVDATSSRAQGGLGVGLSLVRRIVELHDGSVYALSKGPGTGSTFVVRLPMRVPAVMPTTRRTPVPEPLRKIVVVDDNRDAADTIRLLLELMGNQVWVAYDGSGGLTLAEKHQPDVLLLDLGMPEIDGYEVARRVRRHGQLGSTLLIALTGWGQLEDRRASEAAGFDAHLVKPISLQDLQSALATTPRARLKLKSVRPD